MQDVTRPVVCREPVARRHPRRGARDLLGAGAAADAGAPTRRLRDPRRTGRAQRRPDPRGRHVYVTSGFHRVTSGVQILTRKDLFEPFLRLLLKVYFRQWRQIRVDVSNFQTTLST